MGIQHTTLTLQGNKLITIFYTLSFALEKLLVGHILNEIIVIWFFNSSWSRDRNVIFKIMNYLFLNANFALKLKENVERMMW